MRRRERIIGFSAAVLMAVAVSTVSLISLLGGGSEPAQAEALAQPTINCTIRGTQDRDIKTGHSSRDVICLFSGGDYGHGRGGNDIVRGGADSDTLIGGKGNDRLFGKRSGDQLFAVDDAPGDMLRGGRGKDRCYADVGDLVKGCETTHRGATIQTSTSLQQSFGGVMELAEELIAAPGPPGPTFPPCSPPPPTPPPVPC